MKRFGILDNRVIRARKNQLRIFRKASCHGLIESVVVVLYFAGYVSSQILHALFRMVFPQREIPINGLFPVRIDLQNNRNAALKPWYLLTV